MGEKPEPGGTRRGLRIARMMLLAAAFATGAAAREPGAAPAGEAALETIPVAPLAAQPAPAATGVPDDPAALEEIVVTAQKRRESLQDTPISIEAFNTEKLEQRGIAGVDDLSTNVPNLTIEPFPTHNATLRIFIRGVGINDAQITQDPAVGVYMDGVYIARSVGLSMDVAELERIEVLRGPQGTLYGRNTTGGAVNLITRRPALGAFSSSAKLTGGSRGLLTGKASVNVPVGDSLAVKVAGLHSSRDGFVENLGPGGDFGDRTESAGRFDVHWEPASWLVGDYTFEYSDTTYVNQYFQSVLRPRTNKGQAEVFKPYAESQTLFSDQRLEQLASGPPMEESGTRIHGHGLTLALPFAGQELKYVGGLRKLHDAQYADLGGGRGSLEYRLDSHVYDGPAADAANGGPTPLVIPQVEHEQVSHELQLGGLLFDESLQYLVGGYFFHEEAVEDRHRLNHQLSSALSPTEFDELSASIPEPGGLLGLLGITALNQIDRLRLVNFVDFNYEIDNRAWAGFGQLTWTPPVLDERLRLTVGFRHSDDERRVVKFRISDTYVEANIAGEGSARRLSSGEMFDNVPASIRFTDDSWSYAIAFAATPAVNLYAKSDQAYKSGGYNIRDPHISGASAGNTYGFGFIEGFAPERVESREIGIKSEWWNRRLRFNADIFDSHYTDMQINFLIPGTVSDTKVRNAGKARMRGLELETTLAVTPDLTLSADYAYLKAQVLEVRNFQGGNDAHLFPFVSAPPHSFVVAADWGLARSRFGDWRLFVAYNRVGERKGLVIAEERRGLTSIPEYGLLSARFGLYAVSLGRAGSLDFALWGKNLTDEEYPVIAIDNVPHSDRAVVWGEPLSAGLEVGWRFQ